MGVFLAFLKEYILHLLLPPIFQINISDSKPHFYNFQTTSNDIYESWLALEVVNVGFSSAKNVLVYFNGITSNIIKDFDAYQSLPLKKAFSEKEFPPISYQEHFH